MHYVTLPQCMPLIHVEAVGMQVYTGNISECICIEKLVESPIYP